MLILQDRALVGHSKARPVLASFFAGSSEANPPHFTNFHSPERHFQVSLWKGF
jgi:hypothetical protein